MAKPHQPVLTHTGFKKYWQIFRDAVHAFSEDNAMKLGASLAYYTVFAIGPLLLVIIAITGLFVDRQTVSDMVNGQVRSLLGGQAAQQILDIITALQKQQHAARYGGIVGIVTLFIGATGVFLEIQDSINYIWGIKAKPKKGWLRFLTNRLLSFSLIISMGFLLIVSLAVNSLAELLTTRLERLFGGSEVVLFKGVNYIVLFAILTLLFSIIYKVLPDGRIAWRDTLRGAGFTAVLFMIGKGLIGLYLGNSDTSSTYGAAASVIVILTWVYYSSIILYFGAEYTKVYARCYGRGIRPNKTAVLIQKTEVVEMPKGYIPVQHIDHDLTA